MPRCEPLSLHLAFVCVGMFRVMGAQIEFMGLDVQNGGGFHEISLVWDEMWVIKLLVVDRQKYTDCLVIGSRRKETQAKIHTTPGIRWWSPTQLLVWRSLVYRGQSGRDAEFSSAYGRMCQGGL